MTNKDMFEDAFPQDKQVGGSHYKFFSLLVIALVLLGTSIYVGGREEEQHLNTNSCVNCDLSNA